MMAAVIETAEEGGVDLFLAYGIKTGRDDNKNDDEAEDAVGAQAGDDAELRAAELCAAELRAVELCAAELRAAELRQAEVRAAELRAAELRTEEERAAEVRGSELLVRTISGNQTT
ncbi:unnamed protein product [Closterium sp. Naga37s-1]|nr:unnamed protein product [Closterium sp. Naga37s-1]